MLTPAQCAYLIDGPQIFESSATPLLMGVELGRVLINRQPNADLDVARNVRYWG